MSAILNDRDALLQAAGSRATPAKDRAILLGATSNLFKVTNGVAAPNSITLTAALLGMTGNVTFSTSPQTQLTVNGNTAVMAAANTGTAPITVTASFTKEGVTYQASQTIVRVSDGANGTNGSNGSNGYDGQRGTVDVVVAANFWPADAYTQNQLFYSTGYYGPYNRDRMTLTNGSGFSETRFYDNGTWKPFAAWINGNMVVDGTLSANKISTGLMTGQIIQTSAGSTKIILNESGSETLRAYYGGSKTVEIGGGGGVGGVKITLNQGNVAGLDVSNPSNFAIIASGSNGISASGYNGGLWVTSSGANAINIQGGVNGIVQSGGGTNWLSGLNPSSSNAYSLGSAGYLWSAIYSSSSTITTSDERTKKDITDSQLGLAFINDLRTIQYRQKVAERIVRDNWVEVEPAKVITDDYGNEVHLQAVMENQKIVEDRPGVRVHFGLPAQQVRQMLEKHGVRDAAMWVLADKNDPQSQQALRYEELIAPLIRAVQELYRRLHSVQLTVNPSKGA